MMQLYVGVDVAKKTNVCCVVDERGKPRLECSVANSLSGAEKLETLLMQQANQLQPETIQLATEATSVYDFHLLEFLAQSQTLDAYQLKLYRFNPRLIKAFKPGLNLREETDASDAYAVAEYLRFQSEKLEPYRAHLAHLPLQRLTRFRKHLVEQLVREKNYFLTQLFLQFSALERGQPFSNPLGATAMAFVEEFMTPDTIAAMPTDQLVEFVTKHGRNRFVDPQAIVEQLRYVARESYRLRPTMAESLHHVLCLSLANIRTLMASLKQLNQSIGKQLASFPNTLTSIPGIGEVYAAGILAEIGDVGFFESDAQIARLAGLAWKRHESGNFKAQTTRLDRQSNAYLRYYLIEAADSLRRHNPDYREYYQKKYAEVTIHQHKRALVLTARKLVRLVHALLRSNRMYQTPGPTTKAQ